MKTLKLFLFLAALFVFGAGVASAQTSPKDSAEKYGITFPIAELGNCQDYASCRRFCEDSVNQDACISFAKSKGFYREEKIEIEREVIWEAAKTELGCDLEDSCKKFCSEQANFAACDAFAKNHGLGGGQIDDPAKEQILEKAANRLGCDSPESCKSFCEKEGNRQKCSDFAKEVGLRGGEHYRGPGGCTSEETCRDFCSQPQNYQICSSYKRAQGDSFRGPGGCASEESCRSYCENNPRECGSKKKESWDDSDPQEMCSKTPNCSWTENYCRCESFRQRSDDYEKSCRENPEKCKLERPEPSEDQEARKKFCLENPEECKPLSWEKDQAEECAKKAGCSWSGTTCECPQFKDNGEERCIKSGCKWDGNVCECSRSLTLPEGDRLSPTPTSGGGSNDYNYPEPIEIRPSGYLNPESEDRSSFEGSNRVERREESYDPAAECARRTNCSWDGSNCRCSEVRGATTKYNFVQAIRDFIFYLFDR